MKKFLPSIFILFLFGCIKSEKADLVVHNASIYTFNQQDEIFEAMAISDGKVIEMGTEHQIMNRYLAEEYFDGKKKIILPAFVDAGISEDTLISSGFSFGLTFSEKPSNRFSRVLKLNFTNWENFEGDFTNDKLFGIYLDSTDFDLSNSSNEESFFKLLEILKTQNLVLCLESKIINQNPKAFEIIDQVLKGYNDYRWRIENAHELNENYFEKLKGLNLIPIIPIEEREENVEIIQKIQQNTGIVGFGNFSVGEEFLYGKKTFLRNQARENALILKKENKIGILENGFDANFIVYNSNPFEESNQKKSKTNYIFFNLGTRKN